MSIKDLTLDFISLRRGVYEIWVGIPQVWYGREHRSLAVGYSQPRRYALGESNSLKKYNARFYEQADDSDGCSPKKPLSRRLWKFYAEESRQADF
jgi:hypothetical protein